MLDLHRPARGHVARFHPVVDDGAVEPEAAGDFGLAAEKPTRRSAQFIVQRLACQIHVDNGDAT